MESESGPYEPTDLRSSLQYVVHHSPYKRLVETISGSILLRDLKLALLNASKESNTENQADRFDADLLTPCQLHMEGHRYVLEASGGGLLLSPVNAVEIGGVRLYEDHYRGKRYGVVAPEEKAVSVAELEVMSEEPYAGVVKALGDAIKSGFVQAGKRDAHFFGRKGL
jgi:hypothetical protein